jgi:hypothetical protein
MALKMQEALAGNVSQFLAFDAMKPASPSLKFIDAINVISRVNACYFIPVLAIQFKRRAHCGNQSTVDEFKGQPQSLESAGFVMGCKGQAARRAPCI